MSVEDSIKERHSVRKYEEKVVDKEIISQLRKTLDEAKSLYAEVKCKVEIITSPEKVKNMRIGFLGGKVKMNAAGCLVAITEKTKGYFENAAFIQEQAVLKLTEMGIGTCWLGTYDKEYIKKECNVKENEVVTNIIAFGYLQKSFYNNGLRKLFGATKRKSVEEIAFYNTWNISSSSYLKSESKIRDILYLATLAPSANNAQPVRVILDKNKIYVFSIDNKKDDYYKIDAGIFLAHLYLVLKERGENVVIEEENKSWKGMDIPENAKYIASCKWGKDNG